MHSRRRIRLVAGVAASLALLALVGGRAEVASATTPRTPSAHRQVVAAGPVNAVSSTADTRPSSRSWPALRAALLVGGLLAAALAARKAASTVAPVTPRSLRTVQYSSRAPPRS